VTLDLAALAAEAARLLRNSPDCSPAHRVEVEASGATTLVAVEAQMRQIIWNLATNGLRAMPQGGRLQLRVHQAAAPASGVVLEVADEGVGIAPEDVDRIFQPFHGGFAKGAGLGLAIVHRIVTEHGGTIDVRSEAGLGTVIEVAMPAASAAEVAA
jgi:signal transduction histidine kinase